VRITGRRDKLSPALIRKIDQAESLTRSNSRRVLNLLINYGGRAEIVDATRKLLREGRDPDTIEEADIAASLYNPDLPDPELIIRTAGEQRISNFLIWEAAYAEFHYTDRLWPDFDDSDIREAISAYGGRERRFGGLNDGDA
jgi:undecaprenyl diphosphate synthase